MSYAEGYHDHARPDIYDLVLRHSPTSHPRVLDLGCAAGRLGEALKTRGGALLVHGVEQDASAAAAARTRLDRVWREDLSELDCSGLGEEYDVVIAADLLEHLPDPWRTLREARSVLASDGRVVASIPNVRYWKVVADLLFRGEFRYVEAGVLDRTHLRFFTRKGIIRLFSETGYAIEYLGPKPIARRGWRREVMNVAGDFGHVQFHVVARSAKGEDPSILKSS